MPPTTFSQDKSRLKNVVLTRPSANVIATGEYEVLTSQGKFAETRFIVFTLTSPVQTTLNNLWDLGIVQLNTLEGTTTFVG